MDTRSLLDRLPGVTRLELTVVESSRMTPCMQRILVGAEGLAAFSHEPGQDLMLSVPDGENGHFRRRYTIRRHDPQAGVIELQVVVHGDGDGPGARWAAATRPGDRVEAIGPRGKVAVVPDAGWHLFAGDESALPATFAMVEALPPGAIGAVVLEVPGPEDEQPLAAPESCSVTLRWVHRHGRPGDDGPLVDAVAAVGMPGGGGHAYLAGELGTVAAMRRALVKRGLGEGQISAKPYWRRGVANAAHGEPERVDGSAEGSPD